MEFPGYMVFKEMKFVDLGWGGEKREWEIEEEEEWELCLIEERREEEESLMVSILFSIMLLDHRPTNTNELYDSYYFLLVSIYFSGLRVILL